MTTPMTQPAPTTVRQALTSLLRVANVTQSGNSLGLRAELTIARLVASFPDSLVLDDAAGTLNYEADARDWERVEARMNQPAPAYAMYMLGGSL